MQKVVFHGTDGKSEVLTSPERLKTLFTRDNFDYWKRGTGDAEIMMYVNGDPVASIIIGTDWEYGFYLHYSDETNGDIYLSLHDHDRLHEVVEMPNEWLASKGLFLPPDEAWEAIYDFIQTGKPSNRIKWITPEMIPEDGNC